MASLTGTQVKHTYDSLLKLEDNDGLNSGLKKVTDGLGTQSPLSLSEIEVVSSVNVEASGFQTPTGTSDQLLVANGTTTSASALSGANINGTTNYVAKFDSANSVADSLIYDNGTNVGIGTSSPTDLLHIEGASTPTLKIVDTTNTTITELYSNDFDTYLANESSGRVFIRTGGSNGFVVDSAGDVGIGTTNPIYKLDIQAESPAIRIRDISDANSFLVGADNSGGFLGMFTNDSLRVYTNSLERMRITDSGNVGIGTTSPAAKLEVVGVTTVRKSGIATPHADTDLLVTDATAAGSTAQIQILGGNAGGSTLKFADTDYYTVGSIDYSHSADSMSFRTNNNIQATISSTGNVGIGTTSPDEKLRVDGNIKAAGDFIGSALKLGFAGTANITTNDTDEDLLINPNGSGDILMQTSSGNVGIGTTSPDEKLHVSGNAKVTNLYVANNIIHDGDTDTLVSFSTDEVGVSAGGVKQLTVTSDNVNVTDTLSYNYPSAAGQYNGEMVSFGTFYTTSGTIAAGDIIVYTQAGINTGWFKASATTTYGKGMFGIAMGTTAADGILVKGFASNAAYTPSISGTPVYISTTAGTITSTAPSTTGDVVRVIGYMLDATNDEIYFDPDKSWTIA